MTPKQKTALSSIVLASLATVLIVVAAVQTTNLKTALSTQTSQITTSDTSKSICASDQYMCDDGDPTTPLCIPLNQTCPAKKINYTQTEPLICPSNQHICNSGDPKSAFCVPLDQACPQGPTSCPDGQYNCSIPEAKVNMCISKDIACNLESLNKNIFSKTEDSVTCKPDQKKCADLYDQYPDPSFCVPANQTCPGETPPPPPSDQKQPQCTYDQKTCWDSYQQKNICVPANSPCPGEKPAPSPYPSSSCPSDERTCWDPGQQEDICVPSNEPCPAENVAGPIGGLDCSPDQLICYDNQQNKEYCFDGDFCPIQCPSGEQTCTNDMGDQYCERGPKCPEPPQYGENTCRFNCDGTELQYPCDEPQPICPREIGRILKEKARTSKDMNREYKNRLRDRNNLTKEINRITKKGIDISNTACAQEVAKLDVAYDNVKSYITNYESALNTVSTNQNPTWEDFQILDDLQKTFWDAMGYELDQRDAWDACNGMQQLADIQREINERTNRECKDMKREATRAQKEAKRSGVNDTLLKEIEDEANQIISDCPGCYQKVLEAVKQGTDPEDIRWMMDDCNQQMPELWDRIPQLFHKFENIRACEPLKNMIKDMENGLEDGKRMVKECASKGKDVTKLEDLMREGLNRIEDVKSAYSAQKCQDAMFIGQEMEELRWRWEEIFQRTCGGEVERDFGYINDIFDNIREDQDQDSGFDADQIQIVMENMLANMERQIASKVTEMLSSLQTQVLSVMDRVSELSKKVGEQIQKNVENQLEFITIYGGDPEGKEVQSQFLNDQNEVLSLMEDNVDIVDDWKNDKKNKNLIEGITGILEGKTIVGPDAKKKVQEIYQKLGDLQENKSSLSASDITKELEKLKEVARVAYEKSKEHMLDQKMMKLPDCSPDDWWGRDCTQVSNLDLVKGKQDSKGNIIGLVPGDFLTNEEFGLMLTRLLDMKSSGTPKNTLVSPWAAGSWAAIENAGWRIAQDPKTDVTRPITRGDVACMIVDALKLDEPKNPSPTFKDVAPSRADAGCWEVVFAEGILLGQGGGEKGELPFATPDANLNRAEATAVTNRTASASQSIQK